MFVNWLRRQRRAVVPHIVEQIEIGAQFDAAFAKRRLQRTRTRQSEHRAIDCDLGTGRDVFSKPIKMR